MNACLDTLVFDVHLFIHSLDKTHWKVNDQKMKTNG